MAGLAGTQSEQNLKNAFAGELTRQPDRALAMAGA